MMSGALHEQSHEQTWKTDVGRKLTFMMDVLLAEWSLPPCSGAPVFPSFRERGSLTPGRTSAGSCVPQYQHSVLMGIFENGIHIHGGRRADW